MANQPQNKRYKELLDELQLQSWQLELVISGFAIFGLISALEPLWDWQTNLWLNNLWKFRYLAFGIYFSCLLTIVNLIIHVLLRGLWIGAVGIRSVSGEIDFEALKFSTTITNHLKSKIVSFDNFIEKLERYSSVMFGLTFLVIFMTIGFFINFVLFLALGGIALESGFGELIGDLLFFMFTIVFLVISFVIFLDFITRGSLKRIGGRYYLIFYRLTSIITLSVLYRPLLYNFWDNEFGKKIIRWLLPIYILCIFIFSLRYVPTHYFSSLHESSEKFANRRNYENMIEENGDYIGYAAIPSKTIISPYLELTIPYDVFLESMVFEFDSSFEPKNSRIGLKNKVFEYFHWSFGNNHLPVDQEYEHLDKLNQMFEVKIDSFKVKEKFIVSKENDNTTRLINFIDITNLKNGKHILSIQRRTSNTDSTKLEHYETIPFWYFNN
ncbi:hypothetical protein [Croceivirga thetidis]|uniref:Uncharacterized protein n=1 Tax=Croceivirga thetidis TaxID=2721623 RepID=A0ABX1GV35_9FLAO|nr:hypothetical protein [Croceivirga thetidis]NKI33464.1 hypothetical protein [Croceivirga thetidis]